VSEACLEVDAAGPRGDGGAGRVRTAVETALRLLAVDQHDGGLVPPVYRRLAVVWLCLSLPFVTVTAAFVNSPGTYLFVLVFMGCGAYTAPAVIAGWYMVRNVPRPDRISYGFIYAGFLTLFAIGVGLLIGQATGWTWGNAIGIPAVACSGVAHMIGLALLLRSRSGRRALLVDTIEAVASVLAVTAPLVVLWGPTVAGAEHAWFTVPCALVLIPMVWGTYWTLTLYVRLGPDRTVFEVFGVVLAMVGILNVVLQTAQGVSGFSLPAPPLIGLTALCASMYLLIPLNAPLLLPPGLSRLPPQAQVRGATLATSVALAGTAVLLVATAVVADERPWAVPFALGVVSVLLVLAGLRQVAGARETRRLYRQVEEASDERRRLVAQLLERSVHDRRRFAGQLHEQAVAAYASFSALAATGRPAASSRSSVVAQASALVQVDLARHADSLRELILAIRPLESGRAGGERLRTPIAAYLANAYGDQRPPRLAVTVDEPLVLDWVTETVLLQVLQEALHNVWRHSRARSVDVAVERAGEAVVVRVSDDGVGFDPSAVVDESGIAAMRASAAVLGGTLDVESRLGGGTVVTACLGPVDQPPSDQPPSEPEAPLPGLRLVRGDGAED
jgi:signal transduction histidine kinase